MASTKRHFRNRVQRRHGHAAGPRRGQRRRPSSGPTSRRITYSIYLLDDDDADRRDAVAGHDGVSLDVAAVVCNQLQVDPLWTVDTVGYNFCHVPDVSAAAAFPVAGRRYLVEYRLDAGGRSGDRGAISRERNMRRKGLGIGNGTHPTRPLSNP